jgi:Fe-S cluster biogenesis protein NfuA
LLHLNKIMNFPISIYTESTPNPETLKFVTNKILIQKGNVDYKSKEVATNSPLAIALFDNFSFITGVFINSNYLTITKTPSNDWMELMLEVKEFIKNYIQSGNEIVTNIVEEVQVLEHIKEEDKEVVTKIIELLDTYVKPAVEMDGGHIAFKSYDDGIVKVSMQGSCSGCPSSTVTLKSGIEGMLKRMVPQVKEVVAEME